MKEILDFLSASKTFYMATASENVPHVRPLGFVMEYGGKLCFCTADGKNASKHLKENPALSITAAQGMDYVKINGKATFLREEAAVKKALEILPPLAQLIGPGTLEIFCISDGQAEFCSLTEGLKKTVKL